MEEPIDKPHDCLGDWTPTGRLCPNCQDQPLYSLRIKDGVEVWKTHHYECAKCGHMERK